jgi:HPt (histidine-containing phosphotransfer) domain-containing protein
MMPNEIAHDDRGEADVPSQPGNLQMSRQRSWELDPFFANDLQFMVLIEKFVATLPVSARQIVAAQTSRNRVLLTRTVHDLKGSAGMYGFGDLGRRAKLILEALQRDEEWLLVDVLVGALAQQLDAIVSSSAPVSG